VETTYGEHREFPFDLRLALLDRATI